MFLEDGKNLALPLLGKKLFPFFSCSGAVPADPVNHVVNYKNHKILHFFGLFRRVASAALVQGPEVAVGAL